MTRLLKNLPALTLALLCMSQVHSATQDCDSLDQSGKHAAAVQCWSDELAATSGSKTHVLLERAESWHALGHIYQAQNDLEQLLEQQASGETAMRAELLLGQIQLATGDLASAWRTTTSANNLATRRSDMPTRIAIERQLGDIKHKADLEADASEHYQRALELARSQKQFAQQISLLLTLSRLEKMSAVERIQQASQLFDSLPESPHRAALGVSIGAAAREAALLEIAWKLLGNSVRESRDLDHQRLHSRALGELGLLYESQQRHAEALKLARAAIAAANPHQDRDLLLRWEWLQARALKVHGQHEDSLSSHRRAIEHLHAIRLDMPVDYSDGRSSFRDTQEPIYLGLVESLLERARQKENGERQALLNEAQQTMEWLKTAELQDYFKDACAVTQSSLSDLGKLQENTAVLYPIILPDRLELLVQIGAKKFNITSSAPASRIQLLSARLSRSLRPSGGIRTFSKRIAYSMYQQLIEPVEPLLREHGIDTIIYLPDGPLRQIPLESLWDGEAFLVERYAIAIAPGLTLLDPKPIERTDIQGLVAGVAKPGEVVRKLPTDMQAALLETGQLTDGSDAGRNRAMFRAMFRDLSNSSSPDGQALVEGASPVPEQRVLTLRAVNELQEALALPGVTKELERISEIIPVTALKDDEFVLERFEEEVNKEYRIVHIASHGLFTGSPEESFIITHDSLLDMNRLSALFRSGAHSDQPVEILTLSACQTAEGDERSPLGLSGVAIKSGARSAVGSLWPVADEAAQQLLPDFYASLRNTTDSKAKALQQAKLKLMKNPLFAHPTFWSPFILIGNWL